MGIIVGIIGIIITIIIAWNFWKRKPPHTNEEAKKTEEFHMRQEEKIEGFEKTFLEKTRKLEEDHADFKLYLDGLPQIQDKKKQELLNSAIADLENYSYDSAVTKFQKYITSFPLDENERCAVLNFLGISQIKKGDILTSKKTLSEMLLIAERIKADEALSKANCNIGIAYHNLRDYMKGLEHYQRALEIAKKINNPSLEAACISNIASVYIDLREYEKALKHYQQALNIHRNIYCSKGEAKNLEGIGNVYANLGKYEKALKHLQQALKIDKNRNDPLSEAQDLDSIGDVYYQLGEYEKAFKVYQQALAIHRKIRYSQGEALELRNLGRACLAMGKSRKALDYCVKAKRLYNILNMEHLVFEVDIDLEIIKNVLH